MVRTGAAGLAANGRWGGAGRDLIEDYLIGRSKCLQGSAGGRRPSKKIWMMAQKSLRQRHFCEARQRKYDMLCACEARNAAGS
jgi:hypothetical protein